MKSTGITLLMLLALVAGTVQADEKVQEKPLPDAGQLLSEIERQELVFNLSDRVRKMERQEPDMPYGVTGDGILLPDNLCDRPDARGCKPVELRRP